MDDSYGGVCQAQRVVWEIVYADHQTLQVVDCVSGADEGSGEELGEVSGIRNYAIWIDQYQRENKECNFPQKCADQAHADERRLDAPFLRKSAGKY